MEDFNIHDWQRKYLFENTDTANEAQIPSPEALERMAGLVNTADVANLKESISNIVTILVDEGFDIDEISNYLIEQLKDALRGAYK